MGSLRTEPRSVRLYIVLPSCQLVHWIQLRVKPFQLSTASGSVVTRICQEGVRANDIVFNKTSRRLGKLLRGGIPHLLSSDSRPSICNFLGPIESCCSNESFSVILGRLAKGRRKVFACISHINVRHLQIIRPRIWKYNGSIRLLYGKLVRRSLLPMDKKPKLDSCFHVLWWVVGREGASRFACTTPASRTPCLGIPEYEYSPQASICCRSGQNWLPCRP